MTLEVLGSTSSGNCYVLTCKGEKLILDCGVKYADIMRSIDYKTDNVRACLVTHIHSDHSKSAFDLARHGIEVASCQEVATSLLAVHISILSPHKAYRFGGFLVVAFSLPHGDTECYGYYIQTQDGDRLLYATDYEYIPYRFEGLTHMMIECNYTDREQLKKQEKYEHVATGHAALDTALGVIEANKSDALKHVLICHVSASEDQEAIWNAVLDCVGAGVGVAVAQKGGVYRENDNEV